MQMSGAAAGGRSRNLVLAAMIFAVAMTFIDQTIVSIAAPQIQQELGLTSTGVQWVDQRLPAVAGRAVRLRRAPGRHRRPPQDGRARRHRLRRRPRPCAASPPRAAFGRGMDRRLPRRPGRRRRDHVPGRPGDRRPDLPPARARQGAGHLLRHRRRADRHRPVLGGYLTEWTWRAIFWVNIPVALIALVLIAISKPVPSTGRPGWTTAVWC